MEKLSFTIDEFEGPLDLVLHLISKHKLNIMDIEITKLLEQYMKFVEDVSGSDPEVASEFLEMASRLVYIKTVSLLPRHEELEQELKKELTGRLIEYQACRRAAELLRSLNRSDDVFVRSRLELEADCTYELSHSPAEIFDAYMAAMGKGRRRLPPPKTAFAGIIAKRLVSVTTRIIYVLKEIRRRGDVQLNELLESGKDRSELVATFLAVLELLKAGRVAVKGDMLCHMDKQKTI